MKPRYTALIRDLPHGERPRERLRELGPGALSSSELVAILLRTGRLGPLASARVYSHSSAPFFHS